MDRSNIAHSPKPRPMAHQIRTCCNTFAFQYEGFESEVQALQSSLAYLSKDGTRSVKDFGKNMTVLFK